MTAVGIAQRAPLAERGNDLYQTPPEATLALLRAEVLPHFLWEPAAGKGAIVRVPRAAGHEVLASDLADYNEPTHFARRDFLLERLPDKVEAIVTNPPYRLAEEFVAHALDLCPRVIMLLRLAFLESERRRRILESRGLARLHVFRNRLPMMHRDGWDGPRASSATAYAWFCWDRSHTRATELHRILVEGVMTPEEHELLDEAWRAVANAKPREYRRQCWRLAGLVRQGLLDKQATVDRLQEIALAHALVRSLGTDRIQLIIAEAFIVTDPCSLAEVA